MRFISHPWQKEYLKNTKNEKLLRRFRTENMTYNEFKKNAMISMDEIAREIYRDNRHIIKIKKEEVAVKNLTNIFNSTLRLSNRKGFQAMSLRDLCSETGLSMGALYSYFTGKDELLGIIQNKSRKVITKILIEEIEKYPDSVKKLHSAIQAHLFLSEMMHSSFYFSFMEAKNLNKNEQKKAIENELFTEKIFIDILKEGNKEGVFSVDNIILTASVIKAMMQDWYLKRWKYSQRQITVEAYSDFIIDFVENFIQNKP